MEAKLPSAGQRWGGRAEDGRDWEGWLMDWKRGQVWEDTGRSLSKGVDGGATGLSWRGQSYGTGEAGGRGTGRRSTPRPGGLPFLLIEVGQECR